MKVKNIANFTIHTSKGQLAPGEIGEVQEHEFSNWGGRLFQAIEPKPEETDRSQVKPKTSKP